MKFTANGIDCSLESKSIDHIPFSIYAIQAGKPTFVEVAWQELYPVTSGMLVEISGTGSAKLDGKAFLTGMVTLNSQIPDSTGQLGDTWLVELLGSDTTGETFAPGGGTMTMIPGETFCLSSFERQVPAAETIDVTTFCGAESLAGQASPGNIKIKGYIDYESNAYNEWRNAVADGERRWLRIILPKNIGTILMQITPSGLTETFEVNAAAAFEGEAVINQEPLYIIGA